jgi:hypothetical protein
MTRFFAFLLVVALTSLCARAEDSIRAFPIATIEALGQDLYLRDQLASKAFDVLFEKHPEAQKQAIRGWITQADKETRRVYFIQDEEGQFKLAYTATYPAEGEPVIEDGHAAPLPDFVAKRYAARRAALAAIPPAQLVAPSYNGEVLDDPEGKGYLVYILAATTDADTIMVGGHYRVSVSEDAKVTRVDALSHSLLTLDRKHSDVPTGAKAVASVVSHVVSNTPVETHVFVSLQERMPLFVGTLNGHSWLVNEGHIKDMGAPPPSAAKPAGTPPGRSPSKP